jgi:hypothetical protein
LTDWLRALKKHVIRHFCRRIAPRLLHIDCVEMIQAQHLSRSLCKAKRALAGRNSGQRRMERLIIWGAGPF